MTGPKKPKIIKIVEKAIEKCRASFMDGFQNAEHLKKKGVRVGENCFISAKISPKTAITIGNNVWVAGHVTFIDHDASYAPIAKGFNLDPTTLDPGVRKIVIFDNCFIGHSAILLMGVKIGPNAIVGAGAVVTKDVPANTVVGGVPARKICSIEEWIEKASKKPRPV